LSTQNEVDKEIQGIADKIQARLPEDLAAASHFSTFKRGSNSFLSLDFAVKLDSTDYPRVLSIIRDFNGDFGNRKEGGKDVGFFFVPKPNPAATPTQNAATSSPAEKAPSDAKPAESPKQPSPMTLFISNYCCLCEDLGDKCNTTTASGKAYRDLCIKTQQLQALQSLQLGGIIQFLHEINETIKNGKIALPPAAASRQEAHPVQPERVQRNTRPIEGHREDGIIWINDFNAKGESIEKALEKDNKQSAHYTELLNQIDNEVRSGKKGLKLNGKWYWIYQDGTTIGRKPAQEWPQRRR